MKKLINYLSVRYSQIYKVFLFVITVVILVWLFPKTATFKYEFYLGKPWMHDDLIALFDFAIEKPVDEINSEREDIIKELKPYFRYDREVYTNNRTILADRFFVCGSE